MLRSPAVRRNHPHALLMLVGETKFTARVTRYYNRAYLRGLRELVARLGLQEPVHFLGEREDAPEILRASDLALAPSWDEPFGRSVVEAMAMGVPTVSTSVGAPAEIVRDGVEGVLVAPRRPDAWAPAIDGLLRDEERRLAMGAAARNSALHGSARSATRPRSWRSTASCSPCGRQRHPVDVPDDERTEFAHHAAARRAPVVLARPTNVQRAPIRCLSMQIAKALVLARDCRGPEPWPSLGLAALQLAPVANNPVLFHHLDSVAGAGISEAVIVTDETTGTSIREAVGDGSAWGLEILHVDGGRSADPLTSPEVTEFLDGAVVLAQHGDVLVRDRLSTLWEHFAGNGLDALVLRTGYGHNRDRPKVDGPSGYFLSPDVHDALRRETSKRPSWPPGDLLRRLHALGVRVDVRDVDACVPCRGGTEALLEGNRRMLEDLVPDEHGESVFASEIQGRAAIHPSAQVRDSLIRGPVSIGPGATVSDAYIGPYTSIGADVDIDSVEIEHSIIFDRARIRFIGKRIEGSLVGPGAHIERDFRVPQVMRLSVGARAEIALS